MRRKTPMKICDYLCNECGKKFPIPRKKGEMKELNHQKTIYCVYCRAYTIHTEETRYGRKGVI